MNPFNFVHFNINYFPLSIDDMPVSSRQLQPDFDSNMFVEAYHTMYSGSRINFLNQGNSVSRDSFKKGYCLFVFDLTPDLSANSNSHFNLVRHGNVRIDLRFKSALEHNINCLVYAEFNAILEIDSARQCIVDFAN